MAPRPCKPEPCASCPFLRTSMRGYLGGSYSAETFLQQHYFGEGTNPCHKSMDYAEHDPDRDWRQEFLGGTNGHRCRGQAEFFANSCKKPRNPEIEDVPQNPRVFSWPHEFLAHHDHEDSFSFWEGQ